MTPINIAKKLTKARLRDFGFSNRVSGRTIDFQDLARDSALFITVHDWDVSAQAHACDSIKRSAPGAIVTFSGPGIIS